MYKFFQSFNSIRKLELLDDVFVNFSRENGKIWISRSHKSKISSFNPCRTNKIPFQHFNKIPFKFKDKNFSLQYELH